MPTTPITQQQAAQVFALWDSNHGASPERFLTPAEVRAMDTADAAECRATYFLALLREVRQGGAA